jgi:hypothetical protein
MLETIERVKDVAGVSTATAFIVVQFIAVEMLKDKLQSIEDVRRHRMD